MSGFYVVIQATGMETLTAKLKGFKNRAVNLTEPLKAAGLLMLSSINKNFDFSGRPTRWKPLAPSTLKQKIRLGYSTKPLLRTGFLRASIVPRATSNTLTLGTSISYGRYHQYGTRNIPQRKFLMFQQDDIRAINKIVIQYLIGGQSNG